MTGHPHNLLSPFLSLSLTFTHTHTDHHKSSPQTRLVPERHPSLSPLSSHIFPHHSTHAREISKSQTKLSSHIRHRLQYVLNSNQFFRYSFQLYAERRWWEGIARWVGAWSLRRNSERIINHNQLWRLNPLHSIPKKPFSSSRCPALHTAGRRSVRENVQE